MFRVSKRFWSDPIVRAWSAGTRLLALYILTAPSRTPEGLFVLRLKDVCRDLDWTRGKVVQELDALVADGFVKYDDVREVVLIVKALGYHAPANPNQTASIVSGLLTLPRTPLLDDLYAQARAHSARLAEAMVAAFPSRGWVLPDVVADAPTVDPLEGFESFWDGYPKRNGKKVGKAAARSVWARMSAEDKATALLNVRHYRKACDEGYTIARDAERWLKHRTYEDWDSPATGSPTRRRTQADINRADQGRVVL